MGLLNLFKRTFGFKQKRTYTRKNNIYATKGLEVVNKPVKKSVAPFRVYENSVYHEILKTMTGLDKPMSGRQITYRLNEGRAEPLNHNSVLAALSKLYTNGYLLKPEIGYFIKRNSVAEPLATEHKLVRQAKRIKSGIDMPDIILLIADEHKDKLLKFDFIRREAGKLKGARLAQGTVSSTLTTLVKTGKINRVSRGYYMAVK